jgi:predicted NBD/HSP70 family sugar kinase
MRSSAPTTTSPDEVRVGVFITPLHTRIVVTDEQNQPVSGSLQIPMLSLRDPESQLQAIAASARGLLRETHPDAAIGGIGVAIAGQVNNSRTTITQASRLQPWLEFPIAQTLAKLCGDPRVVLGNDAEARTHWMLRNVEAVSGCSFLSLFWGEGIGGCHVNAGPDGPDVVCVEPGHMRIPGLRASEGKLCLCGKSGCLDAYSGGNKIGDAFGTRNGKWLTDSDWNSFAAPVALVVERYVRLNNIGMLVIGGKRYNQHPELRRALAKMLTDDRLQVVRSDLEYAPAHTAVGILDLPVAA